MKTIILAAGAGSRIADDIGSIPKSTLKLNGKPIIQSTVEMLIANGIDVAVCTGYRFDMIENALKSLDVKFFNNPFYSLMNNIGSLWFAREFLDDECMIISADVVFDEMMLDRIMQAEGDLLMVTDTSRVTDGDYFFSLDKEGKIREYGPDIPVERRFCEYVGLSKISKSAVGAFRNQLEKMIYEGNNQCYFEYVFFSFIENEKYELKTVDVSGCNWREIDRIEDYRKALTQFK